MPPPPTAKMKSMSTTMPRQTMRGHTGLVRDVAHLPDGRRIITCSFDGSLRLWDLESGTQIGDDWRDGGKVAVWRLALSPNSKTVASGSSDGTVRLWDVETNKVIARWTGHTHAVRSLCWSEDGDRVVTGSDDGMIRVWDVESGDTVLGPIKTGHVFMSAVIYSPDTTKIATGGYNEHALKIWDAKTGNLLSTTKHDYQVFSLAWTLDQMKLITGSYRSIRIFDTATWQQIAILEGHTSHVYSLSLFQNDRLLTSGSHDGTVRLWNLDMNLPIGPPLQHQNTVQSAAISVNRKQLVTGCGDQKVYVWDIHTTLKDAGLEELSCILDDTTPTPAKVAQPGKEFQGLVRPPRLPNGMFRMPGSPMDEDEFYGSTNDDVDEDMNHADRDSNGVEGNVDEGATGRRDSDEGKEDEPEDLEDMEDGVSEHVHDKSGSA